MAHKKGKTDTDRDGANGNGDGAAHARDSAELSYTRSCTVKSTWNSATSPNPSIPQVDLELVPNGEFEESQDHIRDEF